MLQIDPIPHQTPKSCGLWFHVELPFRPVMVKDIEAAPFSEETAFIGILLSDGFFFSPRGLIYDWEIEWL